MNIEYFQQQEVQFNMLKDNNFFNNYILRVMTRDYVLVCVSVGVTEWVGEISLVSVTWYEKC